MTWRARSDPKPDPEPTLHGRHRADPEDGGYVVTFPALPDLATQGETIEEARWMAEDCLRGYLNAPRTSGRALPGSGTPVPSADRPTLRFRISAASARSSSATSSSATPPGAPKMLERKT